MAVLDNYSLQSDDDAVAHNRDAVAVTDRPQFSSVGVSWFPGLSVPEHGAAAPTARTPRLRGSAACVLTRRYRHP